MKYFKLAICISGEIRTAIETYPVFRNFFDGLDYDVFIHTWDSSGDRKYGIPTDQIQESPQNIEEVRRLYKPKKIIVDSGLKTVPIPFATYYGMFYSMMVSNHLRNEYEIENDCLYETVVKYRFDLVFPRDVKFPRYKTEKRVLYSPGGDQGHVIPDCGNHGITDMIFWGDSQVMNIISDTFRYYKYVLMRDINNFISRGWHHLDINKSFQSPGQILYRRASDHNIRSKEALLDNHSHIPWTILRTHHRHLDPFEDYQKILETIERKDLLIQKSHKENPHESNTKHIRII